MTELLRQALADLHLPEEERVIDLLARHWDLLLTWNSRTNLTAISDPEEAAWRHYRDSLEALRLLPPGPIVDLGSGGGFPGIPLAVAAPDRPVALVESRRKRASFLDVARARLGLTRVQVWCRRMEDGPDRDYAAALTRATFSEEARVLAAAAWLEPGGRLIAFRSQRDPPLRGAERHAYQVRGQPLALDVWLRPRG